MSLYDFIARDRDDILSLARAKLCQAITEVAAVKQVELSAEDFQTLKGCLDDAIAGAVTELRRQREEALGEGQAENARQREEQKYRSLFENSMDAVYVTRHDGAILDANPAACRLHGMTVDEIRARGRAGLLVAGEWPAAAPADRATHGPARAELTMLRKDGATFPAEVESVVVDAARQDWTAFVIARDISARKQREAALREAIRRYERQVRLFEGIASTTPDFVYLFDLQGRFLYANRRLLNVWGVQLADAVGKTCRELGYEQWHHDMHMREIAQVIETRQPIKGEVPFKAPLTGIFGVYEYIFTPVIGPDGDVETIAGTTRDVTDRKRAEEALRDNQAELSAAHARLGEVDRRKTEFLAVLSHELRNPLAPIRNSIHLLERAAPESEQATRAREVVRRQTEHLTRLVNDLLDITRISHGKIPLDRSRVDLREIVRRTTDDLHSVFAQAGITLRVEYVTFGPVWVEGDSTRLGQVLANLLNNSTKFTPRGGTVHVDVAAREGCAELSVRDDGLGMDPTDIEHMFEPFAQASKTLARSEGGLGLGLALVKSIVELHGGRVSASSEGIGRGAEFLVRIPLVDAGAESEKPRRLDTGTTPQTILVIEDNADGARSLADILEMYGHRVRIASDGRTGIALAREFHPDVILCDVGLPDVNGYDVARTLRRDGPLRDTRLVALSGYAQVEDRQRATDAGFDAHLAKPVDLHELMNVLSKDG